MQLCEFSKVFGLENLHYLFFLFSFSLSYRMVRTWTNVYIWLTRIPFQCLHEHSLTRKTMRPKTNSEEWEKIENLVGFKAKGVPCKILNACLHLYFSFGYGIWTNPELFIYIYMYIYSLMASGPRHIVVIVYGTEQCAHFRCF